MGDCVSNSMSTQLVLITTLLLLHSAHAHSLPSAHCMVTWSSGHFIKLSTQNSKTQRN